MYPSVYFTIGLGHKLHASTILYDLSSNNFSAGCIRRMRRPINLLLSYLRNWFTSFNLPNCYLLFWAWGQFNFISKLDSLLILRTSHDSFFSQPARLPGDDLVFLWILLFLSSVSHFLSRVSWQLKSWWWPIARRYFLLPKWRLFSLNKYF